ncbi:MAG: PQQ-dependent sugar dehydrogenase [bacterium]|nr:PQQ-dependent sugar dehydrogenase [bacterium]
MKIISSLTTVAIACISSVVFATALTNAVAQEVTPGTSPWTPAVAVPLVRASITVPAQYHSVNINPTTHGINIPVGWKANVFFAGIALNKPRFLAWGPDSVLFVANMNKGNILALPDMNRDGIADTMIVAASGFAAGHDVRFYRDTMFVSQESGVVKLWRSGGVGYVFDQRQIIINKSNQPNQTGGNHTTRTLVIDSLNSRLFINVGSRGNADREMTPGQERALIETYSMDGSNRRIFATGIRNAVGMTLHPRSGRLWANNNGSDKQGNDIPGEWVDLVREGGFYGYPFAFPYKQYFDLTKDDYRDILPLTANDTALVESMQAPAGLITAHSAPMAMQFSHPGMSPEFRNGAFVVLRGSWNRFPATGAKLVFLAFDNDGDTVANSISDICTGFLPDSNNSETRWARPVGLALDANGSIYLTSDDIKQFILKLTPPPITSVEEGAIRGGFEITPNPTDDVCTIHTNVGGVHQVWVRDLAGKVWFASESIENFISLDVRSLPSGLYSVVVKTGNTLECKSLSVIH